MTKMKKWIIALSALSVACLGVAVANVSPVKGAAETALEANKDGIYMNSGAAVRFDNEDTTGKMNGIRYELLIEKAAYANLEANYNEVTFGVLIAPASYEDTAELNYENVFGKETAVYDWAEWNEDLKQYVYEGTGDKTRIINVSTKVNFDTVDLEEDESGTYYHYYGSMINVNESNIGREFVGVGYVQASDTDIVFAGRKDNVRSMAYVAQKAIADTSDKNKLDDDAKDWLQKNYVNNVADEDTTYTVEYRVNDNVQRADGSTRQHTIVTKEYTVKVDSPIVLKDLQLEGYTCEFAEGSDTKALANDKSVVILDCEYATDVKVELQGNSSQHYLYSGNVIYYITEANKDNGTRTFGATSGVFFNTTSGDITLNIAGQYGDAAIVDKNGFVIEGRDGQNGKLMNEEYTTRAGAPSGSLDSKNFAQGMVVPSGGFAIVVQQSSPDLKYGDGTTANIRDFMHNNIISNYGNIVQISLAGTETVFTGYENKAPVITENAGVSVHKGTSLEEAKAAVIDSIKYSDDNGTFGADDNVTSGLSVTVTDTGSYNANTLNTYTFTLEIADAAGLTTQFTSSVEVKAATFTIGYTYASGVYKSMTVDEETQVCVVDRDTACPEKIGSYRFIIFTPDYTGALNFDNGHGAAFILNKYGEMKAVYDGANSKLYTSTTFTDRTSLDANDYDKIAFEAWDREAGEYLIFAPNDGGANEHRAFLLGARWEQTKGTDNVDTYVEIGIQFALIGANKKVSFATKPETTV